jgi:endonuclease G
MQTLLMIRTIYLFVIPCMLFAQAVSLSDEEISTSIRKHLRYESDNPSGYLIYKGFVVSYDSLNKIAEYSLHHLDPAQISGSGIPAKRRNGFFMDYRLGEFSSTNMDYKGSNYDRGHLVPAGDFRWNQLLKDETFVLTNVAPQNSSLNRGIWRKLENKIRNDVFECQCEALIITGTIVNPDTTIRIGQVGIPESFYKIVYLSEKDTMYAFHLKNESHMNRTLTDVRTTVDRIEILTNKDFFELIPDELENKLESN